MKAAVLKGRKICREKISGEEIMAKNLLRGKAFCVDLRHFVHKVPKECRRVKAIWGVYGEEEGQVKTAAREEHKTTQTAAYFDLHL
jgi:hypothetical protein